MALFGCAGVESVEHVFPDPRVADLLLGVVDLFLNKADSAL